MTDQLSSRRRFLMNIALGASSAGILRGVAIQSAHAAPKRLPATHAQAKALNYVEDASGVKHSMYKAGSNCANCRLFTADTGACSIFPGFSVAPTGWCTAWVKKA